MPQLDRLLGLIDRRPRIKDTRARHRGPATHVVILDGTMSSLATGAETNAGLTYKLLREMRTTANLTLYYEAGIQWRDWKGTLDVVMGRGINRQIERAYGVLASRYHPGDRIILIGYSRGAYAVRSLAGVVDHVGLVRAEEATVRTIRTAYRHYRLGARSKTVDVFRTLFCHPKWRLKQSASGTRSRRWACACRSSGAGPKPPIPFTTTHLAVISATAFTPSP